MNVYDLLIESGIVFLMLYPPLYWGGVTPGAEAVIEIVTALLFLIWIVKYLRSTLSFSSLPKFPQFQRVNILVMYGAMGLFVFLVALQPLPLPALLIKRFSPSTYRLYAESAATLNLSVPAWLPLSVNASATKQEFLRLLVYPTIFFLTVITFRTRRQVNRLVYIVLAMGCLQAVSAFSGFLSRSAAVPHSFWLSGTFVNKNHFAGYLEMVILLGLGVFLVHLETRSSARVMRPLELLKERYPKIALWLIGLLMLVCAHLLSGSRGGWLSLSIGVGCFGVLVFIRRLLRRWVALLLIVLPLATGSVIILSPATLLTRLETLLDLETQSQSRRELWKTGLVIFRDFPVTGTGLGTFSHINQRYRTFRSTMHFEYTHNDYIQLLSETGLVGGIIASLLLISFWVQALTAWRRQHSRWTVSMGTGALCALVSLLVHSTTDFNLHIPSNTLLFTVIAALGTGMWNIREGRFRQHRHRHASRHAFATPDVLPTPSRRSSTIIFRGLGIAGLCWVGWYLFQVVTLYAAFRNYEQFRQPSQVPPTQAALLLEEPDPAKEALERALRYDPKNAEYAYALGHYLHQHLPEAVHPYAENLRHQQLNAAKKWIASAIMRAPTNAWYYYELGRLSLQLEPCEKSTASKPQPRVFDNALLDERPPCAAARYFEAALQNAPHDAFLQETVGRWLYAYAPDKTSAVIAALVAQETTLLPDTANASKQFAQFLYDIRLDYASDRRKPASPSSPSEDASDVLARLPNILSASDDRTAVEFGNDDGTAEWRARLYADTLRVSKVIFLPQDLDSYTAAAVKIYLNNGGSADFKAHVAVDDHLVKTFAYTVPRQPGWYEIPFEIAWLYGKSSITVYIRTTGASQVENYLQIWGDQDTPPTHSVFNFATTDDLSFDDGIQTGEYLIRLVLKSHFQNNAL